MTSLPPSAKKTSVIARQDFEQLFSTLVSKGYTVVGPTVRDGAIVYERLTSAQELPCGWTDQQEGGRYRLIPRKDQALFGYVVGPQSWKKFLYPPAQRLWRANRGEKGFQVIQETPDPTKFAFIGVRSCELHAIQIQDKVFMQGPFVDPGYKARRENALIIAVNCAQAGGTCFCVSMNSGPKATTGYDLALTEVIQGEKHYFVAEVGTEKGLAILKDVPHRPAEAPEQEVADRIVAETARKMGRTIKSDDLKELLYDNLEHPRWDDVASRCLTCANCTMVCPTCFCTTMEDVTDLTGEHAERWRKWDSCFTTDFSYIHGGSVRTSTKSRYRQWMTHKLATWIDQFGTSGCVGCGRCITWCPVGIDITEEVKAIRETKSAKADGRAQKGAK